MTDEKNEIGRKERKTAMSVNERKGNIRDYKKEKEISRRKEREEKQKKGKVQREETR